jgi:hypothetical protein
LININLFRFHIRFSFRFLHHFCFGLPLPRMLPLPRLLLQPCLVPLLCLLLQPCLFPSPCLVKGLLLHRLLPRCRLPLPLDLPFFRDFF